MKSYKLVLGVFIFVVLFRVFFMLQTPEWSDSNSYYILKNIENVKEKYAHVVYDPLSYSGRESVGSPLLYYILAPVSVIPYGIKILTSIMIATLVLITYLAAKEITKDKTAQIVAASISGFTPIIIRETLNKISPYTIALPLLFFALYCFIKMERGFYLNLFILTTAILAVLHPLAILLASGLAVYLLLAAVEGIVVTKAKKEVILFTILFVSIIELAVYKEAFIINGVNAIWNNTPMVIRGEYFRNIEIKDILVQTGIVTIVLGGIGRFLAITKETSHAFLTFSSTILATSTLLFFKVMNFNTGVTILGIAMATMAAAGFERTTQYLRLTKADKAKHIIKPAIVLAILATLIVPSYTQAEQAMAQAVTPQEKEALLHIKTTAAAHEVVAASPEEGHYITSIAERRNVMDTNFMLAPEINERYNDLTRLFTTISGKRAREVFREYNVSLIYFSDKTKRIYNESQIPYIDDQDCFRKIKETDKATVYRVKCR